MADAQEPLKIGVVSGKGGVGKSTVTAALVTMFDKHGVNLVALDCDVDAPNLALLFEPEDTKEDKTIFTVKTTEKSSFNEDECTQCRACVDDNYCYVNAISWDEENDFPVLDYLSCEGCGACSVLCEFGAYSIAPIDSGEICKTRTKNGFDLVHGETIIGASTSGKLVAEVKQYATDLAKEDGITLIVIDGPPGIGCPVLATLTGLDFVIVVMEPFPAAFHDASRVIEVINNFGIPFGIVINRSDAWEEGHQQIMSFIEENGYTFLGDIPIDMEVPKSVVNMQSIITYAPDSKASNSLDGIYKSLKKIIEK